MNLVCNWTPTWLCSYDLLEQKVSLPVCCFDSNLQASLSALRGLISAKDSLNEGWRSVRADNGHKDMSWMYIILRATHCTEETEGFLYIWRVYSPVSHFIHSTQIARIKVSQVHFCKTKNKSKLYMSSRCNFYVCLGWIFHFSLVTTLCWCSALGKG